MNNDPRIQAIHDEIRAERENFEALKQEHTRRIRSLQNQSRKLSRETNRGPALIALDGVLQGAGDFVWQDGYKPYARAGQPIPHTYRRASYKDHASQQSTSHYAPNEAGLSISIYLRDEIDAEGNKKTIATVTGHSYSQGRLFDRKRELPKEAVSDEEKEQASEVIARAIVKDVLNKKSK